MDLITELPPSEMHDVILVCVDRFMKMAHFIPTNSNVTAEEVASLYVKNIFRLHGLPKDIVSDRGQQFTSRFTKRLLELCDIKSNLSMAYHPQSNGQTERTNQTLEQYLQIYGNYQQDNWVELLPCVEFVYNNTESTSTKLTPFFACHGYHPRYTLTAFDTSDSVNPTAETMLEQFQHIHKYLRNNLQQGQDKYKEFHDRHVKQPPTFKVGDQVWLDRRNIRKKCPSQKLDAKKMGPFPIEEVVGESKLAYWLQLPPQMKVHPVFHISLLEPYTVNPFVGQVQEGLPLVEVEGEQEWEVKEVLDSKIVRGKLLYYIDWEGFGPQDRMWELIEHVQHASELIAAYYRDYPTRPSPASPQIHPARCRHHH